MLAPALHIPAQPTMPTITQAMSFRSSAPGSSLVYILAEGAITTSTAKTFIDFVTTRKIRPGMVIFNSDGGDLEGALALGRAIRNLGFETQVGAYYHQIGEVTNGERRTVEAESWKIIDTICESSCAYSFLGGLTRALIPNATSGAQHRLGFHQFRTNLRAGYGPNNALDTISVSNAQAISSELSGYIGEMGVSPEILKAADSAPLAFEGDDPVFFPDSKLLTSSRVLTDHSMPELKLVAGTSSLALVSFSDSRYIAIRQVTVSCEQSAFKEARLTFAYTSGGSLDYERFRLPYMDPEVIGASDVRIKPKVSDLERIELTVDGAPVGERGDESFDVIPGGASKGFNTTTFRINVPRRQWRAVEGAQKLQIASRYSDLKPDVVLIVEVDATFLKELRAVERNCDTSTKVR